MGPREALRIAVAFSFAALPSAASAAPRPPEDAPAFAREADAWLEDALSRLSVVPGLAIAVVAGDEVVFSRGYGLANVETGEKATAETVYYIASATKPFTALVAAVLDARGTLALGSSLSRHLNGVALDPSLVPERVTLRDLLTHTSGIDNGPIAFRLAYSGQHDPDILWELLARSTPTENAPLGTFRYTNVGYNVYAMILNRMTGKPWQDHIHDEIAVPLGLARTTAYASLPIERGWPRAVPHFGLGPGGVERLSLEKTDETMQSAGGMMTTARDLGRWLRFQIHAGRLDGRRLVDEAIVRHTQEALVPANEGRPPFGQVAYGLGWHHGTHRERRVLHHSGGFAGFRSLVSFLPDEKLGVAVLVNDSTVGGRFADVAALWAYDWWLGTPADAFTEEAPSADDEVAALVELRDRMLSRVVAEFEERAARTWMLTRSPAGYAGRYENNLWGVVEVVERDGSFEVTMGNLAGTAEPFPKNESVRVELVPGQGRVIVFEPESGEVERIRLDGEVYARVP